MLEPVLLAVAGWLDDAGLRAWASATPWVYPFANVLHVLGAVMLVGGIGIVDLRIVGLWRRLPVVALSRALTPIAAIGLVIQATSGLVLFAADGAALAGSSVFRLKLVLLVLALVNAAAFRAHWRKRPVKDRFMPSIAARASALLSLGLWVAVAIAGRLIAYY